MQLEEVLVGGVKGLAEHLRGRLKAYGDDFLYSSQESLIVLLYIYSLASISPEVLGRVFTDYPVGGGGSRERVDIFIDFEGGYYVEVKYVRPIPSRTNIPLPQHRGALIYDVVRLLSRGGAGRYLLLVASREFISHLMNKPGFPIKEGAWEGSLRSLVVTKTEEAVLPPVERGRLDRRARLTRLSYEALPPLSVILWRVEER